MIEKLSVLCLLVMTNLINLIESNESPKLFRGHQAKVHLKTGETTLLSCKMQEGSLPAHFEWFKDDMPIQTSKRIIVDSSQRGTDLVLKSLESSDSGKYGCKVSNEFGSDSFSTDLIIEGSPRWSVKPTDIRVGPNDMVNIKCVGISYPMPKTTWKRQKDSEWVNLLDGSTPFIANSEHEIVAQKLIKERDEGKYACELSNGISPDLWTEFEMRISGKSSSMLHVVVIALRYAALSSSKFL
ncbi:tyrosine-protein kinase receptor TYRO3-like [Brevipalpus obovatus]|uniref:tyrosine-protein kinase receptor TYRO3-like n=1 Tax=Brevipalpus obovatus TaxID=246614 RepID=UPI003D9F62F4